MISIISVGFFYFGFIASRSFTHSWNSVDLCANPLYWIRVFRLGFVIVGVFFVGDFMLLCLIFFWPSVFFSIVLIGTGFPSAFASVDWRFRTDYLVGWAITD